LLWLEKSCQSAKRAALATLRLILPKGIALDPEHVYERVFAQVAGQHGILDLLCVTRNRRLAILELKATENVALPLQAADYWSRIRWHQSQGDFARYGYLLGHRTSTHSTTRLSHRPGSTLSSHHGDPPTLPLA
jgi:hypothetical protein